MKVLTSVIFQKLLIHNDADAWSAGEFTFSFFVNDELMLKRDSEISVNSGGVLDNLQASASLNFNTLDRQKGVLKVSGQIVEHDPGPDDIAKAEVKFTMADFPMGTTQKSLRFQRDGIDAELIFAVHLGSVDFDVVTIYEHIEYAGNAQELALQPNEKSRLFNVGDLLLGNDSVSSIGIPTGFQSNVSKTTKVILFENTNQGGQFLELDQSNPDLREKTFEKFRNGKFLKIPWNDQASSIKVVKRPQSGVEIFDAPFYDGNSLILTLQQGDKSRLFTNEVLFGIGNDSIKSILCNPSYIVTLFENWDKSGNSLEISADIPNLSVLTFKNSQGETANWGESVSTIEIRPRPEK